MIIIYNTLTRQKEPFKPIEKSKIKMYVCGPTVYDVPHIGHARSAYIFDVIRRYFNYAGYDVYFVRNITDVDDKIIKKAVSELEKIGGEITSVRLKERVNEVSKRYLDIFHQEMDVLGIQPPTVEPKATENISQMIEFISKLIDNSYAYIAGGSVYFSVDKFSQYGKLSNQNREEMISGARVEIDANKKYPLDFALWKEAKENEPFWESPWGKGRPGWHIECSVMSKNLLGDNFDIHGGGLDLVFPHHENEIAQSEAATGKGFANYWVHNGLLTVEGEKMAKSLGNFITISDFLKKYADADLLKIAFLLSHYRSPMDYSDEKIKASHNSKERIMIFLDKVNRLHEEPLSKSDFAEIWQSQIWQSPALIKAQETVNTLQENFNDAMNDDFNTPQAMAVVFEAVKIGNDYLSDVNIPLNEKVAFLGAIKNFILRIANILGLSLSYIKIERDETNRIEELIRMRENSRAKKDYAEADKIRKELLFMDVVVEDTPEGPVWRKK